MGAHDLHGRTAETAPTNLAAMRSPLLYRAEPAGVAGATGSPAKRQDMAIRRATVFGGAGFIGRYVVKRLAQQGVVITVVGRQASAANYLTPMGDVGQIARINGSVMDETLLRRTMAGADTVINLVGILAEAGRQRFDALQHQAAGRIAGIAAESGVAKLVQLSAIGADPASASRYARSKAAGEQAVLAAFPGATILRPSIVFGPEDQFFNRFASLVKLQPAFPILPLIGGGHTRFQPTYVGDVADAVAAALASEDAPGLTYELGGPTIYSFRELMELLLREIGRPDVRLLTVPTGFAKLAAGLTGWLPGAPLTGDQIILLQRDNVVTPGMPGFAELGIIPSAPELILPLYLERFRKEGWYSRRRIL
jgi:NADH dehydrogenase